MLIKAIDIELTQFGGLFDDLQLGAGFHPTGHLSQDVILIQVTQFVELLLSCQEGRDVVAEMQDG